MSVRRLAAVVPLLVLLAGCSGTAGESSSSKAAATSDRAAPAAAMPVAGKPAVAASRLTPVGRSLVQRAELDVRVDDIRQAATAAQRAVEDVGGAVTDEQLDLQTSTAQASLQLQVPPARLSAVLDRLAGLGREQSRRLGTDDVTEQVIDLDSRLATQRASVARVRALLDQASGLGQVVQLEGELSRREADLESLQARQRALAGQVAMAEVTLRLTTGPKAARPAAAVGFSKGLHGGWRAFTAAARVTAATVGALLPFLPLLVAGGWLALWRRRRTTTA